MSDSWATRLPMSKTACLAAWLAGCLVVSWPGAVGSERCGLVRACVGGRQQSTQARRRLYPQPIAHAVPSPCPAGTPSARCWRGSTQPASSTCSPTPRQVRCRCCHRPAIVVTAAHLQADPAALAPPTLLSPALTRLPAALQPLKTAGLADTWDQVGRRLGEALQLARAADEGASLAGAAGGAAGDALSQLLGLLTGRGRGPVPPPV